MTLSEPVQAFFALPKQGNGQELDGVFTEDARVRDEAQDHVGLDAIKAWWRHTNETTSFTAVPRSVEDMDGLTIVTAEVSGSFPGSPVMLDHRFRIRDGKISELEIK